jgi:hypothetical protein
MVMAIALIGCSTSQDAGHERERDGSTLRQKTEKREGSESVVGGGHLKPLLQNVRGANAASALEVFQQTRGRADEVTVLWRRLKRPCALQPERGQD